MKPYKTRKINEIKYDTMELQEKIDSIEIKWFKHSGLKKKLIVLKIILKSKVQLIKDLQEIK